jgi:hypothetical protein
MAYVIALVTRVRTPHGFRTGDGVENLCRVSHVGYDGIAKKAMLVLSLGPFMFIQ